MDLGGGCSGIDGGIITGREPRGEGTDGSVGEAVRTSEAVENMEIIERFFLRDGRGDAGGLFVTCVIVFGSLKGSETFAEEVPNWDTEGDCTFFRGFRLSPRFIFCMLCKPPNDDERFRSRADAGFSSTSI